MKLSHFVSGSSVILATWLAVTFMYHLPAQRYLRIEKQVAASASEARDMVKTVTPDTLTRHAPIFVSH